MIKNIIFDMDGVLVDSENAIRMACVKMFANMGVETTPEDFLPFTGMGENRFIGGVADKYGVKYEPGMKAEAYKIYDEIAGEYVFVYEKVKELILGLKASGYKVAVASAADAVKVNINLGCMGLTPGDFDAIVTGSDVTRHKPDPMVFLMAVERIRGSPAESVVVEDAISGCQAAKAAGMTCVGVTSTFSATQLKEAGADYIIEKTSDLHELLKDICIA